MSTEHTPRHVQVAVRFGELLDELGIAHMVCGSVASSMHGEPRSTNDIDFVVDFSAGDVSRLHAALAAEFLADPAALTYAVENNSSCNVIHRTTGIKVDLFTLRPREFSRTELERRRKELAIRPDARLSVTTPEDMVLTKLEWFRKGGEVSDRQWRDVCGLLKLQGERLDREHMDRWADDLGVADLLDRAIREAGL